MRWPRADMPLDPVDEILARHGVSGSWERLKATGVANRVYGTRDVILRVATDHPEAFADARTESVAAPAARAAGIPVPYLLAFDDSRKLIDRPYSLWERIDGETLGLFAPDPRLVPATWRAVGHELAVLHSRVRKCLDPFEWLDHPERDLELADRLSWLAPHAGIDPAVRAEFERWIHALEPLIVATATTNCFLHNDIHAMNLVCSRAGSLLAVLDWGDAGWGDPVLELAQVPVAAVPFVLEGYRARAPALMGKLPEARIVWDKLEYFLDGLEENRVRFWLLEELRQFIRTAGSGLRDILLEVEA